jgi:hypothetical protein
MSTNFTDLTPEPTDDELLAELRILTTLADPVPRSALDGASAVLQTKPLNQDGGS